ncbi:MAG: YtzI protein [Bacilli bacterium]
MMLVWFSIAVIVIVLLLTVITTNKAYSVEHTIDPLPHEIEAQKEENNQ